MNRGVDAPPRDRAMRPGLIWTTVVLALAVVSVLLYSRWHALAILAERAVSPTAMGGSDMPIEMDLTTSTDAAELRLRVTNVTADVLPIEFDQPTWNGAPMKERLPSDLSLRPLESRLWVLHPIHPDVARYGPFATAGVAYKTKAGNGALSFLNGQDLTPSLSWDGTSIKIVQPLGRKVSRYCSIRNVRAALRGKPLTLDRRDGELVDAELVIGRLATKPGKGTLIVKFEYQLTPWSPVRSRTAYL